MENKNKLSALITFIILSVSTGFVIFILNKKSSPVIIYEKRTCSCHLEHEKEMNLDIIRRRELIEESRVLSSTESEKLMNSQEEECSEAFIEFKMSL